MGSAVLAAGAVVTDSPGDETMRATTVRRAAVWIGAVALVAGLAGEGRGQTEEDIRIRRLQVNRARTPRYQAANVSVTGTTRDWAELRVDYVMRPDWTDTLDITWYALVRNPQDVARATQQQFTLYRGEIGYAQVARGNRSAVAYLHPSTVSRFGSPEAVAVVFSVQGRVIAIDSNQGGGQRWWERFSPVEGFIFNRLQTPFAMVNFDDFELIRPPATPSR